MGDSFDDLLAQQITDEYAAYNAIQQGEPAPQIRSAQATGKIGQTLSDFNYEGVDIIDRRYLATWNFSLNEAKADPDVATVYVQKVDYPNFQRKAVGSETMPIYDQKRQGDLEKIIFKKLTVESCSTTSTDALTLAMPGINGNAYGLNTGIRTPFVLLPETSAYGIDQVIHTLDERQMNMVDLRYTKMTSEYLNEKIHELHDFPGMSSVPVSHEITDVIKQQTNPLIPKLNKIPVFAEGRYFVLNTKLVQKCIAQLKEKSEQVSLPTTSIPDWKISLLRADGLAWTDTDTVAQMSKDTGLVGEELMDHRITTTIMFRAEYFNIGGEEWNRKMTHQ